MSLKTPVYRILQYSDGNFYVQVNKGLIWKTFNESYASMETARDAIASHKLAAQKPKVINVEYID